MATIGAAEGPIAITGARGRLGSALGALLGSLGRTPIAWGRQDFDLDRPETAAAAIARDRPRLIIHCAAWTDVDGCARDPELALRRNGVATGALAQACALAGTGLVVVSTNEVFDGRRTDGRGYGEGDPVGPLNAYGSSKLAGELAAAEAWAAQGRADGLWIARTAWLFGPPGADFPSKIVAAADRLPAGEPLPVVADEVGSPTFAPDLAAAIVSLVGASLGGTYHLVNAGAASRIDWARAVLARLRPDRPTRPIGAAEFVRASNPPAWGVLDGSRAARLGVVLRPWEEALDAALTSAAGSAPYGTSLTAAAGSLPNRAGSAPNGASLAAAAEAPDRARPS